MSLLAKCVSCKKTYTVANKFAGKKAKCKACGGIVVVPPLPDVLTDAPPARDIPAPKIAPVHVVPRDDPPTIDVAEPEISSPSPAKASARTQKKPREAAAPRQPINLAQYYSAVYVGVPLVLIAAGYLLPIALILLNLFGGHYHTIVPALAVAGIALFFGVVLPLALIAIKTAAQVQRFDLVERPYIAIAAAFAACPLFVYWATTSDLQSPPAADLHSIQTHVLTGLIWAAVPAFFVFWLLLRVDILKTLIAWAGGLAGYLLGIGMGYGVLLVGSTVFDKVAHDTYYTWANGQPPPGPAVPVAPPTTAPIPAAPNPVELAATSRDNLLQMYQGLSIYLQVSHGAYPAGTDVLRTSAALSPSTLQSPFGRASTGPDYVCLFFEGMPQEKVPPQTIIIYDQGQRDHDNNTTSVLRAAGTIETLNPADFSAALVTSTQALADVKQQYLAALAAATAPPTTVPTTPAPANVRAPDQPWTGVAPDPMPTAGHQIPGNLVLKIPRAIDVFYPEQPNSVVGAGDFFGPRSTSPTDIHEVWNLATGSRIGVINGPLPLQEPVLSPDGAFIAGKISGPNDILSLFQISSFRINSQSQTITEPPTKKVKFPHVIGFIVGKMSEADDVLIFGDRLDAFNCRTGELVRGIDVDIAYGPGLRTAVSPNGKLAAIIDHDDRLTLVDTSNGKVLGNVNLPPEDSGAVPPEHMLAFSPNGAEIALYSDSGRLIDVSVADARLLHQYQTGITYQHELASKRFIPFVWLPDSSGWILANTTIVDSVSGAAIYQIPPQVVVGAEEFGSQFLIDNNHVLKCFKAKTRQLGFATYPIPAGLLNKARAAVRASIAH